MIESFFNQKQYGSFINGKFIFDEKSAVDHFSVLSKEPWKKISLAKEKEIKEALETAKEGFKKIKSLSAYERAYFLKRISELLLQYKESVAELFTREMGKPIREAKGEVEYAAGYFAWFSEEAKRTYGYSIPSQSKEKFLEVRYEPIGIAAVMTPWNFPLAMAARKIAPALAAGCSVITRPSSNTPLSLLVLGAMAEHLQMPKGTLNILIGEADPISQQILADPLVRKLSFTGSCEVGALLYSQCVSSFKKATLELGGHAPLLVFEDANLDKAVQETIRAKFRISGQTCICANRILVHKNIASTFVEKFSKAITTMKVGNPLEEETDLSNVLHPSSYKKVTHHIQDALDKGAICILKGKEGHDPTLLTHVTPSMVIFHEETFGPVAAITTFSNEQEAIALANDSLYGLASYVFTENLALAERIVSQLQYGIIGLNDGLPSAPNVPFGGIKYSGFGREGGPTGIYEYLYEKFTSKKF